MSEIYVLKESWSTDMSPTAVFTQPAVRVQHADGAGGQLSGRGVYPGWCTGGCLGGVLYRVLPSTLIQDPYLVIFSQEALPTAK